MSAPGEGSPPQATPPTGAFLPPPAAPGGIPTASIDIPICAVFLALFLTGAISHMTIFRRNLSRGHKFIPSAMTFGFCMARIVACSLRIAFAKHQTNTNVAIASQIFIAAGVLILFIINLLFAQRMLRATHSGFGWSLPVSYFFKFLYVMIVVTIIMVITVTVQSFLNTNPNTRRIDRDIQLYGAGYFTFFSFLPLPILAFVQLAPRRKPIDAFGAGSWSAKVLIVGVASTLMCLSAGFRLGINAKPPRPIFNPAWYQGKAAFYSFGFVLEVIVVYLFLLGRIDKRFYVPDGSSKVRNYSSTEKTGAPANARFKSPA